MKTWLKFCDKFTLICHRIPQAILNGGKINENIELEKTTNIAKKRHSCGRGVFSTQSQVHKANTVVHRLLRIITSKSSTKFFENWRSAGKKFFNSSEKKNSSISSCQIIFPMRTSNSSVMTWSSNLAENSLTMD